MFTTPVDQVSRGKHIDAMTITENSHREIVIENPY